MRSHIAPRAEQPFDCNTASYWLTGPPAVAMEKLEDRQQELSQQAQILKQREGSAVSKRHACMVQVAADHTSQVYSSQDSRLYATRPSGVCMGGMQACSRRARRRWSCRVAWRRWRLRRLLFPGR